VIALVGLAIVIVSVLGGFTLAGGHVAALLVPAEYLVICGTAIGSTLAATPRSVLRAVVGKSRQVLAGNRFTPALYLDALRLLYELFQLARRDGLIALESHIEEPAKSSVFSRYPSVLAHQDSVAFLCDSLRLVLLGSVPPHDLEALLADEIEVHHEDESKAVGSLTRTADALPGIGIVAAVLGIVVTMQAIGGDMGEIGRHVASALVGTFLGILLSYGFVSPIAASIENLNTSEVRYYNFLKEGVVAFAKGFAPIVAVEFARRAIFAAERPTFEAMEEACKATRKEKA
jgi:chemotaxis protein MotA